MTTKIPKRKPLQRTDFRFARVSLLVPHQTKFARDFLILFAKNMQELGCANSKHCCSAIWAFSFHCRFTIFHCNPDCIWVISFCSAFYAIHACHSLIHPPSSLRFRSVLTLRSSGQALHFSGPLRIKTKPLVLKQCGFLKGKIIKVAKEQ